MVAQGGLFHPDDDHQEIAFRYAVEKINSDRTILPRSKLLAQIERISPQDSFLASKRGKPKTWILRIDRTSANVFLFSSSAVCHLLGVGVAAIFGPQSSHTASHVQSICDTMELRQLQINSNLPEAATPVNRPNALIKSSVLGNIIVTIKRCCRSENVYNSSLRSVSSGY
uniref:Receptor ligand binding region domain-containing protein n=1 Tax=Anopheles atroparvus TaxID=41427 RepID=A0A182IYX6_ANOAO